MDLLTHNQTATSSSPEKEPVARLFDIKKMAVHDGPGIRTTVFFKGCPLKCQWCHSPESMSREVQIKFVRNLCQSCGTCAGLCPKGCHLISSAGEHLYDRSACETCGLCVGSCPNNALGVIGYDATLDEVTEIVLKDRKYFKASGGGVTFSGGEAMTQWKFVKALAQRMQEEDIHVALDTCGFADGAKYDAVLPHVDLVLFDVKETDPERHLEFTGKDNTLILENLRRIDASGTPIMMRCVLIPGLNAESRHLKAVGELADSLKNILQIDVLPFHPFGASKAEMIGGKYALRDIAPVDDETADEWIAELQSYTRVPVKRG